MLKALVSQKLCVYESMREKGGEREAERERRGTGREREKKRDWERES